MSLLVKNEIVLAKIESSYGVDPTPTGASNSILIENVGWAPAGLRMNERKSIFSSLAQVQKIYGGSLFEMSFDVELKGSGAAGTAPEIGPFLRACGLSQTIVAATSVTYAPVNTGHESVTIYYYEDGRLTKLKGARGDCTFKIDVGGLLLAQFKFTGRWTTSVDAANPTPTYNATLPPVAINATAFAVGGQVQKIGSMEFALNNTVALLSDITDPEGYGEVRITERDIGGSMDPELVLNATRNYQADLKAGTRRAFTTGAIGPAAGNLVTIAAPQIYFENLGPGDRDGVRTYQIAFRAVESVIGASDEFSIALT